jgi:hypothetical protein
MWKISDFAAKLREAKGKEGVELISAPFFTSQHGYKLQVSLSLKIPYLICKESKKSFRTCEMNGMKESQKSTSYYHSSQTRQ